MSELTFGAPNPLDILKRMSSAELKAQGTLEGEVYIVDRRADIATIMVYAIVVKNKMVTIQEFYKMFAVYDTSNRSSYPYNYTWHFPKKLYDYVIGLVGVGEYNALNVNNEIFRTTLLGYER